MIKLLAMIVSVAGVLVGSLLVLARAGNNLNHNATLLRE